MNQFKWKQTKNKIWIQGIYSLNKLTLLKWNLGLKKKNIFNTNLGKSKIKYLTLKINYFNKQKFYKST